MSYDTQVDVLSTSVFITEMAMKIAVMGLVAHEGAYLRSGAYLIHFFT